MNGEYLRVTAQELQHAIDDPEWAYEYADRLRDAQAGEVGGESGDADRLLAQQRFLTTHKTWHAISFLLNRVSFPVDVVFGEETFTAEDDDWGYGPPRYLPPQRVAEAAKAFAAVTFGQLIDGIDPCGAGHSRGVSRTMDRSRPARLGRPLVCAATRILRRRSP